MLGSDSFSLWRAVIVFCKQRPYMWWCYHNSASWLPRLGLCLGCRRSQDQGICLFLWSLMQLNVVNSRGIPLSVVALMRSVEGPAYEAHSCGLFVHQRFYLGAGCALRCGTQRATGQDATWDEISYPIPPLFKLLRLGRRLWAWSVLEPGPGKRLRLQPLLPLAWT